MQPLQNQQTSQQLPSTGNPQNIGVSNIINQQNNLQQTAGREAFSSSLDRGVPIKIDASDLTAEIQRQAAPPATNTTGTNMLWSVGIVSILIAIVLWYIGARTQKKNA